MIDEFRAGYQAANNQVCDMFDAEHTFYQHLWKSDANVEEMQRSEIRLRAINEVICMLTCKLKDGIK